MQNENNWILARHSTMIMFMCYYLCPDAIDTEVHHHILDGIAYYNKADSSGPFSQKIEIQKPYGRVTPEGEKGKKSGTVS